MQEIAEPRRAGELPLRVHPGWERRFPWLAQGITARGDGDAEFDLGLFGGQPVGEVMGRWEALRHGFGMRSVVHARQVHGSDVWVHRHPPAPGLAVMSGVDGHLSDLPAVLLAVSVADCVPVFLVAEEPRAVALLHAGWRGVAGGIVEHGVAVLVEHAGVAPDSLWLHTGPSICGRCYEVGPEVHRAVRPGSPAPEGPRPIDLRAAIQARAQALGLDPDRCSCSAHCTRCGAGSERGTPRAFFSHRAGDAGRQMAVLGIR